MPNGEHFITSVLWVVSEGVWFRKWATGQKKKAYSHEAVVLSQQIMYVQPQGVRQTTRCGFQGHLTPSACTHPNRLTKLSQTGHGQIDMHRGLAKCY